MGCGVIYIVSFHYYWLMSTIVRSPSLSPPLLVVVQLLIVIVVG